MKSFSTYQWPWRFAKEGGTVGKKLRVPSLTQKGPRNFVMGGGSVAFSS